MVQEKQGQPLFVCLQLVMPPCACALFWDSVYLPTPLTFLNTPCPSFVACLGMCAFCCENFGLLGQTTVVALPALHALPCLCCMVGPSSNSLFSIHLPSPLTTFSFLHPMAFCRPHKPFSSLFIQCAPLDLPLGMSLCHLL